MILWKFTLQLAPALEGMKRSPCLLGEDTGELAGVRVRRISATWKDGRLGLGASEPPRGMPRPVRPTLPAALGHWPLNEGLDLGNPRGRSRTRQAAHVLDPAGGSVKQEEPETLAHSDHDGQKAWNEERLFPGHLLPRGHNLSPTRLSSQSRDPAACTTRDAGANPT